MAELERLAISARIKQARKEAGLTQQELAELLDVIPRSVQNYETDRVPWAKIEDIARVTGKNSKWLLHGDTPDPLSTTSEDDRLSRIEAKLDELLELVRPPATAQPPPAPGGELGRRTGEPRTTEGDHGRQQSRKAAGRKRRSA